MTTTKPAPFLRLERRIAAGESGGVIERWRYGRALLDAKSGRKQLPHGMLDDLIKAAGRAGLKVSEREIRRRIQCADVYDSEAKVGHALADFGSWSALADAGFPPIEDDDFTESEDLHIPAPDAWEQLSLLPGFGPEIKLHGRKMRIADATVGDLLEYRDKYRAMHEGFGKTLALIESTMERILAAWDGDPDANAAQVWQEATAEDAETTS